ncbi:MAG: hypothetical protein M1541_21360 [Acidobacteria bacterium]|nr:hypothetical protein [Acidobacteriota bacterium]
MEMRDEDETARKEECECDGVAYEPGGILDEPTLPACIRRMPRHRIPDILKLTRSTEAVRLMGQRSG